MYPVPSPLHQIFLCIHDHFNLVVLGKHPILSLKRHVINPIDIHHLRLIFSFPKIIYYKGDMEDGDDDGMDDGDDCFAADGSKESTGKF